ncbi:hypothetical protein REXELLA_47 [Erwinia phage vB_EamP_Rexella]|uniref:Uncharacterized protein n=2 Tax=Johnsonvirus TaxID=1982576 RepID=A0A191ZD56_9CAUD|nr:hypothetical protein REXELLA_47 [Erwinia phage vB_EamP_Rexella]
MIRRLIKRSHPTFLLCVVFAHRKVGFFMVSLSRGSLRQTQLDHGASVVWHGAEIPTINSSTYPKIRGKQCKYPTVQKGLVQPL